jgi:CubicO group peptidase (beta-lactamase class C family)
MPRVNRPLTGIVLLAWAWLAAPVEAVSGTAPIDRRVALERLQGFDGYMEKLLRDWNGVGFGVGVVVGDELVYVKGYGYRDYGRKLPVTPRTLFPIASNTKLFAAVSAGFLVEEGALTWDEPVRQSVPSIRFYDDELDRTVTLRDMLAHRTGITRHDAVWAFRELSTEELFGKLRYLEPSAPLRQTFLYNNLMYAAVSHIVALKSGRPWDQYVREKILQPLDMRSTVFSITEMTARPDHGVPYTERRDSAELYRRSYYEETGGVAAAGAIISNLEDLSHWLVALMNEGRYRGRQVLPAATLKATLEPAMVRSSSSEEVRGWRELLSQVGGMGRRMAVYRGSALTYHGGDMPGFHSQISYMPAERIGVITFVIGDHTQELYDPIGYQVYERLLELEPTPWSERLLEGRRKDKIAAKAMRARAGEDKVRDTRPSHALADYAGDYEHPAYGSLRIGFADERLRFAFLNVDADLNHYHYDRFDTPDDEEKGRYSVNFAGNPLGDIDRLTMSLDEAEVTFSRRPDRLEPRQVERLVGSYVGPAGDETSVAVQPDGRLAMRTVWGTTPLLPYRGLRFRIEKFSDVMYQFLEEGGRITGLRRSDPDGVIVSKRK